MYENCPVSVSLIARYGGDRFLLDTIQTMHASLKQKADEAGNSKSSADVVTKEASAEIAKEKVKHSGFFIKQMLLTEFDYKY